MNLLTPLLLVGVGAAALKWGPGLIDAANVGSNLRVNFDRIDGIKLFGGVTNPRMSFKLYLKLTNPTKSEATINDMDISLNDDKGRPWATVNKMEMGYKIAKQGSSTMAVPVEVKLTNLLLSTLVPAVFSLFQKSEKTGLGAASPKTWQQKLMESIPAQLTAEGNLRVNGIRVPVNEVITVRKPTE